MGDKKKFKIEVYLLCGIKYSYEVDRPEQVREHADAIIQYGYRHNNGKNIYIHWPPHQIKKVQCIGAIPTKYPDEVSGT